MFHQYSFLKENQDGEEDCYISFIYMYLKEMYFLFIPRHYFHQV